MNIALVSYINTRPFLDGLEREFGKGEEVTLHLLPPSDCARALFDGQAELALIPVGSIPLGPPLRLLPSWCIGANGPVESVFVFSQRPIKEVEQVWLDRHSRSSNALAQILFARYWNQDVRWLEPANKHFDQIDDTTAGVVIGDEAIRIRNRFAYQYDLSEAWKAMTGLPFAFAVWAYLPGTLDEQTISRIESALSQGVAQKAETAHKWAGHFGMTEEFAEHYLSACIDFKFDDGKHEAVELYLSLIQEMSGKMRQPG